MRDRDTWGTVAGGVMLVLLGIAMSAHHMLIVGVLGDVRGAEFIAQIEPGYAHCLRWLGAVAAIRGGLLIASGLVRSSDGTAHVTARVLSEAFNALAIPPLLWLRDHVESIPSVVFRDGQVHITYLRGSAIPALAQWVLTAVIAIMVIRIALSMSRIILRSRTTRMDCA